MTGRVDSLKVASLFLMLSSLSSTLPLVCPRSSTRFTITSSLQSNTSTALHSPTSFSKILALHSSRGNPSIRKPTESGLEFMAVFNNVMVTSCNGEDSCTLVVHVSTLSAHRWYQLSLSHHLLDLLSPLRATGCLLSE